MAAKPPLLQLSVWADDVDVTTLDVYRRTILLWEKTFRGRSASMLDPESNPGGVKYEYLYEIAYLVARVKGLPHTEKFSDFGDVYEVDAVEDEEPSLAPDPTQVAAPTEP